MAGLPYALSRGHISVATYSHVLIMQGKSILGVIWVIDGSWVTQLYDCAVKVTKVKNQHATLHNTCECVIYVAMLMLLQDKAYPNRIHADATLARTACVNNTCILILHVKVNHIRVHSSLTRKFN